MDWSVFVIKPSSHISGYCYSILRLEPYGFCGFSCIYCYARWYRRSQFKPQWNIVKMWRKIARKLSTCEPKPYFRLATLSDPFPPQEKLHMVSLEMMRIALKYNIPIIINTKSTLLAQSPWIDVLKAMAEKKIVVVQISIAFSDKTALLLEPNTPLPSQRINLVSKLSEYDIPVVVRLQPLIPGLEDEHLWIAEASLNAGAKGLIGESIRETREGFQRLSSILGYSIESIASLEPYQSNPAPSLSPLYRPAEWWRKAIHTSLYSLAKRYGRSYGVCKEGFQLDENITDCCLTSLGISVALRRLTLRELTANIDYQALKDKGYVHSRDVQGYPNIIRKAIKIHENKLLKMFKTKLLA